MTEDPYPAIVLRVIVDGSLAAAERAWTAMQEQLGAELVVNAPTIKPYWKIPDTHEVVCVLQSAAANLEQVYGDVTRRLGSGWADPTDDGFARWSVWNRGHGTFAAPSVRWAHLELIRGG